MELYYMIIDWKSKKIFIKTTLLSCNIIFVPNSNPAEMLIYTGIYYKLSKIHENVYNINLYL
jgi:hypothetical protein